MSILALAAFPAAGHASLPEFLPAQPAGFSARFDEAIALDDSGRTAVVGTSFDRRDFRLKVATGSLDAGFAPERELAHIARGWADDPQVVWAADGTVLVAWAQQAGRGSTIQYSFRTSGGQFGKPRTLAAVSSASGAQLRLSADPRGSVLAVWRDARLFARRSRLRAARWPGGNAVSFDRTQLVTSDGVYPSVVATGRRRWMITWAGGPQRARNGFAARFDRSVARPVRLGPVVASTFTRGIRMTSGSDGTVIAAWLRREGRSVMAGEAQLRVLSPVLGRVHDLADQRSRAVPSIALGSGQVLAATRGVPADGRHAAVLAGLAPSSGPFSAFGAVDGTRGGQGPGGPVRAAWTPDGPLLSWLGYSPGPCGKPVCLSIWPVRVASPRASGGFDVATVGVAGRTTGLQVASSRAGTLIAWRDDAGQLVTAAAPAAR